MGVGAATGLGLAIVEERVKTKDKRHETRHVLVLTLNGADLCRRGEFDSPEAAQQVAELLDLTIRELVTEPQTQPQTQPQTLVSRARDAGEDPEGD